MALQNFVTKLTTVSAAWLNSVDVLLDTVFGTSATKALARTALTSDAALEIANGGTGGRTAQAAAPNIVTSLVRSPAEIAAGVTPVDYTYPVGDYRRYGPAIDGVTDDTTAMTNWLKVGGQLTFPVPGTSVITAAIPLVSNSTITAVEGAIVQTATQNISMFTATSKNHILIRGLHFKQTSAGATANLGGVYFSACNDCVVEYCEFEGMQFAGIWASAVSRCTFRGNYIHDPLGSGQDSCDIYVEASATTTSSYNVIDGNFCYGTTFEFGIAVWDPYSGVLPIHNIVCNNRIKAHNGYGILIYMPDAGDSFNQIIGNHVQDISAHSTNTDSGAGIYLAGIGMGGTQIIGNTVKNCCITTSTASLAPAGIGVNGSAAGSVPLVISGNIVEGMTKYFGILLTGCAGGASVVGNTVRMPAANTTGDGIRVVNSSNVGVNNNTILQLNTTTSQRGILFFAQAASGSNCTCNGNTVNGGHFSQIEVQQTSGNVYTGLTIIGNILTGGDASCIPLMLDSTAASDVLISNNYVSATTVAAVSQTACTNVRYSNNRFKSSGTTVVTFAGTNTACYYDKTNIGSGTGAGVNNSGTGTIVEQLASAAPVAGVWAVGDRIEQSVPVVGNPKGWRCTVAGTSGTWVSEGNL